MVSQLLMLALALLVAAQQPNVPESLKNQAISTATYAIQVASESQKMTLETPQYAGVSPAPEPVNPAPTIQIDQDKNICSTTFYVKYGWSDISMYNTKTQKWTYASTSYNGSRVYPDSARFVYRHTEGENTLKFFVGAPPVSPSIDASITIHPEDRCSTI